MAGMLDGRRVVIGGAAANIGRATALLFAAEGARLVLADLDERCAETAEEVVRAGGEATFVRADLSESDQVEALFGTAAEALGGIDVSVSNAAVMRTALVTDLDEDDWDLVMKVNPRSCFLAAKYGVPHLRRAERAAIVNMSSVAALKSPPGSAAYAASKAAIVAFTKTLAAELAPDRIRANTLCPGWVDTTFNTPQIEFMGGAEAQAKDVREGVPLGRQAQPEEIAQSMLFLASDMSSYMTGKTLVVDGGVL